MRVRRNERGETEAYCSRCRTWKPATQAHFYFSTEGNRRVRESGAETVVEMIAAAAERVSFSRRGPESNLLRSQCRECESQRQRAGNRHFDDAARRSARQTLRQQVPLTQPRPRPAGRAFGVELELTGPDATSILAAITAAGIQVRNVGAYRATNGEDGVWEFKHDSSVNGYGHELVSPRLYGEDGFAELRTVCRALQSVGATVNPSCGLHVHLDFTGVAAYSMRRQLLAVLCNQGNVLRMVAPSRRNGGYSPSWRAEQIEQLAAYSGEFRNVAMGPRGLVNLGSYTRHGSVEFRSHGGSTNYAKISAWVRFLFAACESESNRVYDTPMQWLAALQIDAEDQRQLLRFEVASQNAQALVEREDLDLAAVTV